MFALLAPIESLTWYHFGGNAIVKNELVVELECLTFPASRWGDSPLCTLLLTMLIVRYPCLSAFNPMPSSWHSHWWRSGPIRKECLHILQVGSDTSLEWFVRPVFSIRRPPIITSTTIQPLSGKSGGSLAPWAMGNSSAMRRTNSIGLGRACAVL